MTDAAENSIPLLTVVIPVYNGENFLRETLESVLAQDYPAVEVIVVNDGSTDGTRAVAEAFGDRVRILDRPNSGVSASRNAGLTAASTEWVALMDHDDLWEKEHLRNLARAIAQRPESDVCYSGGRELTPDPVTGVFHPDVLMPFPTEAELPTMLMERCAFIPSATAVRRSAVLAVGGFDSRFVNLQDWELWLRLFHNGAKFIHTPEPTLLYRVHPASRTHKALQTLKHSVGVIEQHVLPHFSWFERATRGRCIISRLEGEAAILLRQNGSPGALALMLKSIARHPFHELRRYKIAAHMLLRGYPKTA
ncbi:glycosyltransferase family 2 protein [Edaphobacter sp. HDX4]|uniref:glycosyltransferase family 2 protein n=1 Tax=Edaphobacter sp. HDX4 TaxID=2794064 RepID=UPI002FE63D7D